MMTDTLGVRRILKGNPEQDAEFLTYLLRDIQQILKDDNTLSQKVNFSVKTKGSQDERRLEKLLTLQGPDPETHKLLQTCGDLWLQDPRGFWTRPPMSKLAPFDPQTQIVGYILQTSRGDA